LLFWERKKERREKIWERLFSSGPVKQLPVSPQCQGLRGCYML
jgi:hypothetical protein